jgi:uncharacterized protein YecT (DUF1311 family)
LPSGRQKNFGLGIASMSAAELKQAILASGIETQDETAASLAQKLSAKKIPFSMIKHLTDAHIKKITDDMLEQLALRAIIAKLDLGERAIQEKTSEETEPQSMKAANAELNAACEELKGRLNDGSPDSAALDRLQRAILGAKEYEINVSRAEDLQRKYEESIQSLGVQAIVDSLPGLTFDDIAARVDPEFTMVLLGATGSGKTTFLNLLHSLDFILMLPQLNEETIKGLPRKNDTSKEADQDSDMKSKTQAVSKYSIPFPGSSKKPTTSRKSITVLDTPGLGDTGGIEKDKAHVLKIVAELEKHEVLHCIVLVINGKDTRMNAHLEYVLGELSGILPRNVMEQIVVVFTQCATKFDLKFDLNELKRIMTVLPRTSICIDNPHGQIEEIKKTFTD